jgi:hypothetical protein
VALSVGSPLPRVTRHTALWSSDFPRPFIRVAIALPNSVSLQNRDGNHSSSLWIAPEVQQSTQKHWTGRPTSLSGNAFLFDLAPCGVYHAAAVASVAVRSYRTFSPLPR